MEQNNKKIFVIAAVLAIFTSALIYVFLNSSHPTVQNVERVSVIVAAKDISARTTIKEEDFKEVKIEKSQLSKNAILKKEDIINKTLKDNMFEGEQFIKTRLADDNSNLSFKIPEGKRAITINVNEASAVGFYAVPGDYVDVITTLQKEKDGDKEYPRTTKTLLQNVLVLGVGKNNVTDTAATSNAVAKTTEAAKTVTLAVDPESAEKIALSEEAGILRLVLRPVGDKIQVDSVGITRSALSQ